jgi:nucleotide-binding universal stress UspA family protein
MPTLHSILVPIDGSPASLAALEHAMVLAEDYGATIEVLHIVLPNDPLTAAARVEIERAMDASVERAREALGERLSRRTVVGEPLREIIDAAENDVDLIVMGTHGLIGRLHSVLGSVAEGTVRNAPCPVLTVRDTGGGYQSFAERRHHRPSIAEQARDQRTHH